MNSTQVEEEEEIHIELLLHRCNPLSSRRSCEPHVSFLFVCQYTHAERVQRLDDWVLNESNPTMCQPPSQLIVDRCFAMANTVTYTYHPRLHLIISCICIFHSFSNPIFFSYAVLLHLWCKILGKKMSR